MLIRQQELAYQRAKHLLLKSTVLRAIITRYRARTVDQRYARVAARYAIRGTAQADTAELLQSRLHGRSYLPATQSRRPRVLWVGTDEFQDKSGLLQALSRHSDVTVFTQENGRYGQLSAANRFSFTRTKPNAKCLLDLLDSQRERGEAVDLVLGQMLGGYIDTAALDAAANQFRALVVNISMDDRHVYQIRKHGRPIGTKMLIPHVDVTLTAAPEAVSWYEREQGASLYFPEASDASFFAPIDRPAKVRDVSFVGACYGIREELVTALRKAGISVATWGDGWPEGRLAPGDTPEVFRSSRIILGVGTVGHSRHLVALKLRDFDGPMSGSCYVTQDNADLYDLYRVGHEIVVYRDPRDCVNKVGALLNDSARRSAIGEAGRRRAERDHTWDRRFSDLFQFLNSATQKR